MTSIEEALQKILDCIEDNGFIEEESGDDSIFEAEEDCMVVDSLLAVESIIGQDSSTLDPASMDSLLLLDKDVGDTSNDLEDVSDD